MRGVPGPVGAAIALVAGATACLFAPVSLPAMALVVLCVMVAIAFAFRRERATWLLALVVFAFAWTHWHVARVLEARLPAQLEGTTVRVTGRIADLPIVEPRRVRFHLRVDDHPSNPPALRDGLLRLAWYARADA